MQRIGPDKSEYTPLWQVQIEVLLAVLEAMLPSGSWAPRGSGFRTTSKSKGHEGFRLEGFRV